VTATEKYFLELLAFHINGKEPTETDFDPSELLSLARKHKLVPVIYSALKKAGAPLSTENEALFKNGARLDCAHGIRKEVSFYKLLSDLEKSDISPIVVKGVILSSLYPEANTRFSTDQDLLFTKEDLKKAEEVFKENGLIKNDRAEDDTVQAYMSPVSGLYIEAHTSLFPEYPSHNAAMNKMFNAAFENSIYEVIGGARIRTLCPTKHLLFLILHSFKHFVYCGFGIRQITDFIVYAAANKEKTDSKMILESLERVNALGFFDAILCICREHFGYSPEELGFEGYEPEAYDVTDMTLDVLSGGAYGNSTKERLHSSKTTLAAADGKKTNGMTASLFPPLAAMKSSFPYLSKHPYLLPAAWVVRIFSHFKKDKKERAFTAGKSLEIGKVRLEMMRKYKIIK